MHKTIFPLYLLFYLSYLEKTLDNIYGVLCKEIFSLHGSANTLFPFGLNVYYSLINVEGGYSILHIICIFNRIPRSMGCYAV